MALPTITFHSQEDSGEESDPTTKGAGEAFLDTGFGHHCGQEHFFFPLLFDLLKQHYRCGQRVFVRCRDQQQLLQLDEQLWALDPHNFLAHSLEGETTANKAPIVLGTHVPTNIGRFFCWINLTEKALLPLPVTHEIIELISNRGLEKQQARERYKMYCKNGIKPAYILHNLTDLHRLATSAWKSQVIAHA